MMTPSSRYPGTAHFDRYVSHLGRYVERCRLDRPDADVFQVASITLAMTLGAFAKTRNEEQKDF